MNVQYGSENSVWSHLKSYVCTHVFEGDRPVLYVTRADGGDWCFLCGDGHPPVAASYRVVGMSHVLESDPALVEVLDLYGEQEAEREAVGRPWVRTVVPIDEESRVAQHLRGFLGPPSSVAWAERDGRQLPFQLVSFPDVPAAGTVTYSTLGLSRHRLDHEGRPLRQELLVLAPVGESPEWATAILSVFGEYVVKCQEALARGQMYPRARSIPPGSNLSAAVPLVPFPFAEPFALLLEDGEDPVVFVLIVPITESEMQYIEDRGPEAFEDLIQHQRPQLSAFNRPSLVPDRDV